MVVCVSAAPAISVSRRRMRLLSSMKSPSRAPQSRLSAARVISVVVRGPGVSRRVFTGAVSTIWSSLFYGRKGCMRLGAILNALAGLVLAAWLLFLNFDGLASAGADLTIVITFYGCRSLSAAEWKDCDRSHE